MHIVWDWNGTLFDDLEVVVRSVNHGLEGFGAVPIDLDGYRSHYTRPVKLFYDRVVGREITEEEWITVDRVFHDAYRSALDEARLTPDAAEALATGSPDRLIRRIPRRSGAPGAGPPLTGVGSRFEMKLIVP